MYEIFAKLLEEKGLKAADVTRATGIKSPVFSEWKKGKSKPNTEKMIKIANFLGVSVEYLTTGKEPEINDKYYLTDTCGRNQFPITGRICGVRSYRRYKKGFIYHQNI